MYSYTYTHIYECMGNKYVISKQPPKCMICDKPCLFAFIKNKKDYWYKYCDVCKCCQLNCTYPKKNIKTNLCNKHKKTLSWIMSFYQSPPV